MSHQSPGGRVRRQLGSGSFGSTVIPKEVASWTNGAPELRSQSESLPFGIGDQNLRGFHHNRLEESEHSLALPRRDALHTSPTGAEDRAVEYSLDESRYHALAVEFPAKNGGLHYPHQQEIKKAAGSAAQGLNPLDGPLAGFVGAREERRRPERFDLLQDARQRRNAACRAYDAIERLRRQEWVPDLTPQSCHQRVASCAGEVACPLEDVAVHAVIMGRR